MPRFYHGTRRSAAGMMFNDRRSDNLLEYSAAMTAETDICRKRETQLAA